MKRFALREMVVGLSLLASLPAVAAGVHQHGLAKAAVVLEGESLTVSFRAPLMDILGTEQPPADAAAQVRYEDRLKQVSEPLLPESAECLLNHATRSRVTSLFPDVDSHDHDHDHSHHVDVEAEWTFQCRSPGELTRIILPFLDTFSGLTTEVVLLLPQGQGAIRLAPGNTRIPLE
ncbi:MAG: ZrgA family zinc uptake protein [Alcanivorax sp.]|uniref:ZrgA family zinc uptake protein n=1 Tax=Alcanivorax sp. TaxID=1872427 RepID=UPI003DA7A074